MFRIVSGIGVRGYHNRVVAVSKIQVRFYAEQPRKKGTFSYLADEIKKNFQKDEQLQKNIQKFREDYQKLEQSEALKKAREKFENIQKETKQTEQLKQKFSVIKETVEKSAEELGKSEYVQKGKQIADDLSKTAGKTAETIYKQTETISQTKVYKGVAQGVKAAKDEIEEVTFSRSHVYKRPERLLKRSDLATLKMEEREVEPDSEATGMVMHKDSQWQQSWQQFKDNNQFVNKMFDMKTKYDESDHLLVRATRTFTDKMSSIFGNAFKPTDLSEVLTEIKKIDVEFSQERFISDCRNLFIPNILEAAGRGDLEVLKDWCLEAEFNKLSMPVKQAKEKHMTIETHIIDIGQIDLLDGRITDQGPAIIISFHTQQTVCVRNRDKQVIEGDPDKVMQTTNIWALCRDQSDLDPRTCWRLVESHSAAKELFL